MSFFKKIVQTIKTDVLDMPSPEPLTERENGFVMDAEDSVTVSLFEGECSPYDSKVGGLPYMPVGFHYPMDLREGREDKPLAFLAQINFEQLPPLKGFPSYGILQFYVGTDYMYGLDTENLTNAAGFRVIYHEIVREGQQILTQLPVTPEPETDFPVARALKMGFTPAVSVIGWQDFRYDANLLVAYQKEFPLTQVFEDIPVGIRDKMEELCNASGSRIGGFPLFTQSDPRSADNSYGADTVLLFQLDSDPANGVSWGDDGVCNFFITPEQLAKRDFSHVLYHWDCY